MTDLPPSNLESAYGFADPAFNWYMNVQNAGSYYAPPRKLLKMAGDMSTHYHPLVRYAAGWAVTEAGTINHQAGIKNGWALHHREEALAIGNTIWYGIEDSAWEYFAGPYNPTEQTELWSFNVRQQISMAYLPALQLAARARAGEPITAPDAYGRFDKVKQGLIPIIHTLLADPDGASLKSRAMRGLASEIAAGWLLQREFLQFTPPDEDALPPDYIVTPASLRNDHHSRVVERCDLNIYSLRNLGKRHSVQVGLRKELRPNSFEITQEDLGGSKQTQQAFLQRIYRNEVGRNRTDAGLANISRNLQYGMKRYQKQHPSPPIC